MTSSKWARPSSRKKAPWEKTRNCSPPGKHLRILTKAELALLFRLPGSELGRLGRHGLFRRVGIDRYLLDYNRSILLLSCQDRPLFPGSTRWQSRPAMPAASSTEQAPESKGHNTSQNFAEFYPLYEHFLKNSVNILSVPDLRQATMAAGMFLMGGLQNNEQVAVVSFEHPDQMFRRFAEAGLSLDDALQAEQLIYLYYKPDVAHSLTLSVDYRELFREVERLAGEEVKRLVLFNVDALINANSEHLVHTSLHQLIFAANHFHLTLLGLFVASGHTGELLDEGCRAILPGYFVLK